MSLATPKAYDDKCYWDSRYLNAVERKGTTFEWYLLDFASLRGLLIPLLASQLQTHVAAAEQNSLSTGRPPSCAPLFVVDVGCGNSVLLRDMADAVRPSSRGRCGRCTDPDPACTALLQEGRCELCLAAPLPLPCGGLHFVGVDFSDVVVACMTKRHAVPAAAAAANPGSCAAPLSPLKAADVVSDNSVGSGKDCDLTDDDDNGNNSISNRNSTDSADGTDDAAQVAAGAAAGGCGACSGDDTGVVTLSYLAADVRTMTDCGALQRETCALVIDKATLDAVDCGDEGGTSASDAVAVQVLAALVEGGVFVIVSCRDVDRRMGCLERASCCSSSGSSGSSSIISPSALSGSPQEVGAFCFVVDRVLSIDVDPVAPYTVIVARKARCRAA